MTETRATARLPGLDVEIRHRAAPEEGAEYLAVSLRATPDLDTATRLLRPFGLMPTPALLSQAALPWQLWQGAWAGLAMAPWLAGLQLLGAVAAPPRLAPPEERPGD